MTIKILKEPLNKSMIGIQLHETANSATVPEVALPPPSLESYFVAKLENIPDIPCVLRLVFGCLRNLPARPGLIQRFLNSPVIRQATLSTENGEMLI